MISPPSEFGFRLVLFAFLFAMGCLQLLDELSYGLPLAGRQISPFGLNQTRCHCSPDNVSRILLICDS